MFDNKHGRDRIQQIKSVKKNLPYTVRDIGNAEMLAYWKEEQKIKDAEWQVKKEMRRHQAIEAFNRGAASKPSLLDTDSPTVTAYKRYQEQQQKAILESMNVKRPIVPQKKPSWLQRVTDRFVNWLTSLKL